jgi:type 1 glutamine amidotransferase
MISMMRVGLGVLAMAGSLAALGADKKVLLVAGRPSHPPGMHEFRAGMLLFEKCLAEVPGVQVRVASNGWPTRVVGDLVVDDPAPFEGVDAVVIYADGGGGHPAIQGQRTRWFDALAKKGVGLGFVHFGVEVPKGDPGAAMHRWVGGYYEHLFSVNPMWKPEFATLPEHPVTRGVKPFATHDEWYFNMRWVPGEKGVTPILVATPSDKVRNGPYVYPQGPYEHIQAAKGRAETMMWVHERENGGRGFGFTGGHTHKNWTDPNQRRVLLNAVVWIAGMDVPANGIQSSPTDADLAANQDKK